MWGAAVMDLAIWLLCLGLPYGTKAEDFGALCRKSCRVLGLETCCGGSEDGWEQRRQWK